MKFQEHANQSRNKHKSGRETEAIQSKQGKPYKIKLPKATIRKITQLDVILETKLTLWLFGIAHPVPLYIVYQENLSELLQGHRSYQHHSWFVASKKNRICKLMTKKATRNWLLQLE